MTRKRKILRQRPPVLPRVENPDALTAWVVIEPPDGGFDAVNARGGPLFETLKMMGLRVQLIAGHDATKGPGPSAEIEIHRPWTQIFMPVGHNDFAPIYERLPWWCSVIMDCHFPIMNPEMMIGSEEAMAGVMAHRDQMIANLALAEAVTVPHPRWAANLAALNPNTFYLPDFKGDGGDFVVKLGEIANTAATIKLARVRDRRDLTGE